MNEKELQNRRMNQIVFGFVIMSLVVLATVSRTSVFTESSGSPVNEVEYVQLPVFGFFGLVKI